jgi:hydrogenase nickel incorporation protein HypA/HybF
MHELSITEKILDLVLETAAAHGAKRVSRVRFAVGELSGIVPGAVATYFELIAKETIAAGAQLDFRTISARLYCSGCRKDFDKPAGDFSCPDCGGLGRLGESGRECFVESIEVDEDGDQG